jgi:hypothetical protein
LIGDRAYDADGLDLALAPLGVEMIAPHRRGRVRPKTQDGRPLRRYRRRWKIERLFAWLGNFRRLVVCYERHALNYLGLVRLTTILTTIAHCLLADWRRRLLPDRTRLACVSPTSPVAASRASNPIIKTSGHRRFGRRSSRQVRIRHDGEAAGKERHRMTTWLDHNASPAGIVGCSPVRCSLMSS